MRGDAAHSAHAREEKCYDPRSCPRPGVARLQGVRPRLTCRRCAPARRHRRQEECCARHGAQIVRRKVLRHGTQNVRGAWHWPERGACAGGCIAPGASCVRRVAGGRIQVRVAHLAQFYRNSICTPLLTWRTWRLSVHLAPVCAPGACLCTWRLSATCKICASMTGLTGGLICSWRWGSCQLERGRAEPFFFFLFCDLKSLT